MKDLIKKEILEFQKRIPFNLFSREINLPVNSGKIISVCGVRRSGKTYLLSDTVNKLIYNKVNPENILYFSFDDERIVMNRNNLDMILQAYRELYPENNFEDVYIFFDEIQMAEGWEQFVRRIYDSVTRKIYISGSNSKLLATDIATSLRGRTIQIEVFPLSFSEYCTFSSIEKSIYIYSNHSKIINGFKDYLRSGGFPEIIINKYPDHEKILQEYYQVMLFKDIVERYEIKNVTLLKYFIRRLLSNLSKPSSINKIFNELKSAGFRTDKNILYKFVDYLEAIYLVQRLSKYDKSVLKAELTTEKKIYFIDNGLINSLNYTYSNDWGKLLENAVFLWLRSQKPFQRGLYFYKGKQEVDFLLFDKDKPQAIIQTCYDISNPDTLKREISGLIEASRYLSCNNMILITSEQEENIKNENKSIRIIPAYKLFLKIETII